MTNSLDLDPEWGAIDLLEEVEAAFGITIANNEAERCCTLGDLYDLVCAHAPAWDEEDGHCGSSMVFYRIRRALSSENKRQITPKTELAFSDVSPSRLLSKLTSETGLRLPSSELASLGVVGSYVLVGGILAAIVAALTGHLFVGGISAVIALTALPLLWLDPGRFPKGVETISDLVQRTVPLNAANLKENGGRPADRWSIITALAAEHSTLLPDEMGPETFFHRMSLELATAQY